MKRRKGKKRPATVGHGCMHVKYDNGTAVCALKDTACDKSPDCGYEPADSSTADRLFGILNKGETWR